MIIKGKNFILTCFVLQSIALMGSEAPKRKVKEMIAFDEARHPHQVKCFIESYISGRVTVDTSGGSVVFEDFDTKDTVYTVSHIQAIGLLESLRARKQEMEKFSNELSTQLVDNPFSNLSPKQIEQFHVRRFINFESDQDMETEAYNDAFKKQNQKSLEAIAKKNNYDGAIKFPRHLSSIYTAARVAGLERMLPVLVALYLASSSQ